MATKEGFSFEFRGNGVLEVLQGNSNMEDMEKQVQERRNRGYDIRFVGSDGIKMMEPSLSKNFLGGIFCPNDANANSYALAKELYKYLTGRGVSVLENTEVADFQVENDKIVEVKTSKGSFSPKHIINAAGHGLLLLAICWESRFLSCQRKATCLKQDISKSSLMLR